MIPEPHALHEASAWVVRFAHLVRPQGRILDVACGSGRHARHFAARGHPVLAVDRDAGAVAALGGAPNIEVRIEDLESGRWPFGGSTFDGVVVTNYLHRPLLPHLIEALAADGALIYETFAEGNEAFGRPSNPAFLLKRDELLRVVGERLVVVAFEQGTLSRSQGLAVVQRLAAVGRARGWPPALDGAAAAPPASESE